MYYVNLWGLCESMGSGSDSIDKNRPNRLNHTYLNSRKAINVSYVDSIESDPIETWQLAKPEKIRIFHSSPDALRGHDGQV